MPQLADSVRQFNRFYTRQIGLLRRGYLDSPFSLAEVRVLYELATGAQVTASDLAQRLNLDPGYLSRMLRDFQSRALIARSASKADARQSLLSLTAKGRREFRPLDAKARAEANALLRKLSPHERASLVGAMHTIQNLLGASPAQTTPYRLRRHRPGDIGWVIHRHGALYKQEYGWDERFEALVAEIAAKFIQNYDPKCERAWIAERDGAILGCVFLVRHTDRVAKLRMLLVEPSARGLGLGNRLVDECIRFARRAGYKKITLWTQSNLSAARHIYKKAGFELVSSEPHRSFDHNLVSETWTRPL